MQYFGIAVDTLNRTFHAVMHVRLRQKRPCVPKVIADPTVVSCPAATDVRYKLHLISLRLDIADFCDGVRFMDVQRVYLERALHGEAGLHL